MLSDGVRALLMIMHCILYVPTTQHRHATKPPSSARPVVRRGVSQPLQVVEDGKAVGGSGARDQGHVLRWREMVRYGDREFALQLALQKGKRASPARQDGKVTRILCRRHDCVASCYASEVRAAPAYRSLRIGRG